MIKAAIIVVVAIISFGFVTAEKVNCQEQLRTDPQPPRGARLFDSYAGINSEDLMARLDNLAIQLQNDSDVHVHIIVYGPKGEGGGTGNRLLRMTIDYLVNSRGIDETRIGGDYGGRYKDPKDAWTELWLAPLGTEPPAPRKYQTNISELKGKFAEYDDYDGPSECEGPCSGSVTTAGFADALREQPESVAYIVVHNQQGANIGTWRRVAKSTAADLESRGIRADRINIIFAGTMRLSEDEYPQQARVQLWILPKDASPPVKEAKPEPLPKQPVQLGTFHDYELKYAAAEKLAFEGFADVLKANNNLAVCIIVRPPLAPNFRDPELLPIPDEPPDIDFAKLIEKWKEQLAKNYQVESRRIFVITAAAREGNDGTIETWIIPPGAAMPDPYADDSIEPPSDKPMEF
jgi:hypothetical protein